METDLLAYIAEKQPKANLALIEKAYRFAEDAHKGQIRESGAPYIVHPVEVARILFDIGMDSSTISAGLLHDVVEDTPVTKEQLLQEFGPEISEMVDGVTKISQLDFDSKEEQQAESLRKMLLAMANDIRVVLIRLADRLHNMRTLQYCPPDKQKRIAKETLDIFAPLASRLGMYAIKWQLEDLAFKAKDPDKYREIENHVDAKRSQREEIIRHTIDILKEKLEEAGIHCSIDGRPKHYYSIYRKMHLQNRPFDQIYDLIAVRIIVDTENDCYTALGIVHTLWKPIPGRFKDYIAVPKSNMYQSLHTTLIGHEGIPFEVQIRTWDMHRSAEYGIAAHWMYKEQRINANDVDVKLSWLRRMLEWQDETSDSMDFINTLKVDLFTDEVFVFTPKGLVIELPTGANSIDFAYRIHSAIGNKCVGSKVNGRMVPLDTPLKTGDIVEIITSNASKGPSWDWLNIAKTPQARTKIRAWLKKERREENIERGKAMFDAGCKRLGVAPSALLRQEWLDPIFTKYTFQSLEDMYSAIGYGGVSPGQVLHRLYEQHRSEDKKETETTGEASSVKQTAARGQVTSGIIVKGQSGMLVRLAKCCNPVPQDAIIGFVTRGRGVSVHRVDCPNLQDVGIDPERFIEVDWAMDAASSYQAELYMEVQDKPRLLVDISNIIQAMNTKIISINAHLGKNNVALISLVVEIRNKVQLDNLIKQFHKLPEVIKVNRVKA
ncbi:MAG: RelA/SpoT family protein [Christensenellales bacterium]|jgi:guanosine-3',5'-bis(diphosphate) 3'-pyrophosphohydrolase